MEPAKPQPLLRCLIVDDESPARQELRYLLDECEGVQVIGAAATADEALLLLNSLHYDIVFLDIRMPGMSGLELAAELQNRPGRPQVVFTTAHPDHAVEAFDLSATDYLLKPLSPERLAAAIARVRSRLETDSSPTAKTNPAKPGADTTQPSTASGASTPQRLPIQRGDRTVFVHENEIVAASAAHGYTYVHLTNERVLVNYSLTELEDRLSASFFRVHRSYLANLNRLVELRADFKGSLVLVMNDTAGTRVPVSRRQGQELRRRLGLN